MSANSNEINKIEKSEKIKEIIKKVIIYLFLGIWALIVLFPFYWMILTSVKSYGSYNSEFIPKLYTLSPTLQNYLMLSQQCLWQGTFLTR